MSVALSVPEPIVRRESLVSIIGENDPRARHPVGFFAVDQMADDIERAESFRGFIAAHPWLCNSVEQSSQSARRPLQNVNRILEIKIH